MTSEWWAFSLYRQVGVAIFAAVNAMVLSSCAGIDAKMVSPSAESDGFRYYETAPFLFIHSDGKGGLTSEIVWLPDTTQLMSIKPYAWLASNNVALTFLNGTLTEASSQGDETAVLGAGLDAIAKVLGVAAAADLTQQAPPPYLFKIVIKGDNISLIGGGPLSVCVKDTTGACTSGTPFPIAAPAAAGTP